MFAALPQTERAWRRLDAENTLRAFARRHGSQLTILRAPGIYALERLPLTRLMQNTPLIRPEEDSYSNHIHADDLASLCIASLQQNRGGIRVYNACDQEPLTITDWYAMLADALSLPLPPPPRAEVQAAVSPALMVLYGRVTPLSLPAPGMNWAWRCATPLHGNLSHNWRQTRPGRAWHSLRQARFGNMRVFLQLSV
jgi:nucleoside-diphosphate-sugar epimerase